MANLSPKTKLLRAWLRVPCDVHRSWLLFAANVGVCWVCQRPDHEPAKHFEPLATPPGRDEYVTLALVKGRKHMGWNDAKAHAAARPEFISLKEDGDTATFIALSEPAPQKKAGFEKGTSRDVYRIHVLPVASKMGEKAHMIDMGIRQFEAYAEQVGPGHERKSVVVMMRHGAANSQDTYYTFSVQGKANKAQVAAANKAAKTIVNL